MACFAMSDIHGYYDEFIQMVDHIIQFDCLADCLILCGNYIDHGPKSYDMVNWIINNRGSHIVILRGSHEQEFIQYVNVIANTTTDVNLYNTCEKLHEINSEFDRYDTIRNLIKHQHFTIEDLFQWKELFNSMPYYYHTVVAGKTCYFCHAGFKSRLYDMNKCTLEEYHNYLLYNNELSLRRPFHLIYGHSSTLDKHSPFFNNGNIYYYEDNENHMWAHNINCGIKDKNVDINAKLGCLCVDTNESYYIR